MRFAKAYVEITNVCNLNCSFCPKTTRPPRFMSRTEFRVILERLKGYTEFLYFHLMGEPLLHPEVFAFFELAHEMGYRVILTTNGTCLPDVGERLLSAPGLHKVNLSLQSFEANQTGSIYDYVNQCASFAARAGEQGILINLRLWNLDGSEASGRNRENQRILSILSEVFPKPWLPSRGGQKLAERVYLNWGETFRWPDPNREDVNLHHFCYGLKDQIGILCDGTVVPCCLDHDAGLPLGNLFTEDVESILSKPRTLAMIRGFQAGKAVEHLCQRCGYANRFHS